MIKLFSFKGIDLILHWSFFILFLVYPIFSDLPILQSLIFLSIVFISVILHEYGHALCAKYFDVDVKEIKIYFFGGAAFLEEDIKGKKEFWITLCGPLVNVVIAAVFFPFFIILPKEHFAFEYIIFVIGINIALMLFNMIPAWPLDGGRILRSILSMKFLDLEAIKISSTISQILCIIVPALIFWYDSFQLNILIIFIFIFIQVTLYKKSKIEEHKEDVELNKQVLEYRNTLLEKARLIGIDKEDLKDGKFFMKTINTGYRETDFYINLIDENPKYYFIRR